MKILHKKKKIGIALIPSPEFIEFLITLQKVIQNHVKITPIFGRQQNLPHLTLLQGIPHETERVFDLFKELHALLKNKINPLSMGNVSYVDIGWYFLQFANTPNLFDIHELTFQLFKEFLEPPSYYDAKNVSTYSGTEKDKFFKYGYRYIGIAYKPHITIGRSTEADKEYLLSLIKNFISQQKINNLQEFCQLTLYRLGKDGAHESTIEAYKI